MRLFTIFAELLFCGLICLLNSTVFAADERVFCDFESDSYGNWTVEGTAFGPGPARGSLPGQMTVSGFQGKRLVNSYFKGDGSVGKLTSPEFAIEYDFINFLIGGGGHPGTHFDLIVDGKAVRTARGPNVVNGGTEALVWDSWNVKEFKGKKGSLQIVDQQRGGWGHINIDQIVFSNVSQARGPKEREILIEKKYLWLPVKTGAFKTWMQVTENGRWYHEFEIELAESADDISFYASYDVHKFIGQKMKFKAEKIRKQSHGLDLIKQSDILSDSVDVYKEKYRPQFHFSPRRGWTNDPNGLVFFKGQYHLFFQHNPYGVHWGNMTWGHAVSRDLFHWQEQSDAILADQLGTIFSGSAVVDWNNTSGLQKGSDPPIVCLYTQNGPNMRFGHPASQSLAYSVDGGKTFQKYEKNPIIPHIIGGNRDPKVFWYEPIKRWIMALYMDREDYALFESQNLLHWEKICDIKNLGCSECPDMFELPVDGNEKNKKWVFWGGNGKYLIGSFDGKTFHRESKPLNMKWGGNDYAAQSYSDTPGRRIQFSWMNGGSYPNMPFNQQFSLPRELTLRSTPEGIRLCTNPVKELEQLRRPNRTCHWKNVLLDQPSKIFKLEKLNGPSACLDIVLSIRPEDSDKISISAAGQSVELDLKAQKMTVAGVTAPLPCLKEQGSENNTEKRSSALDLRIVLDRMSIEVFARGGLTQIAKCFVPRDDVQQGSLEIKTNGQKTVVESLDVWSLVGVWPFWYGSGPMMESAN